MYGLSFDKINVIIASMRTSTVVTAPKKVKMITSTHNLLSSSQYKKVVHFFSVFFLVSVSDFLYWKICPP